MHRKLLLITLVMLLALIQGRAALGAGGSLIGRWMCDEGQGDVVSDSSGNKRNGRFVNGPGAWTTGVVGSAVELVGPTLVEIPSINMTLSEATMAGWLLADGLQPEWASIIMHRGAGSAHGFNMLADGRLAYHWNDDSASWGYRGDAYYAADEWTHCAVTVEPTKATFYVNGVAASVNAIRHNPANWNQPFHLGGDGGSGWVARRMNGALDDVMFFSRALNEEQVAGLMDGVLPMFVKAEKPDPADGTIDVMMALFQWTAGETAVLHNVYLGTSPELTEADAVAKNVGFAMYFHPLPLSPGITYFWRVDEIEASGTIHQGDVWSFQMMPLTAYVPQPPDGSEGVFANTALTWQAGSSAMKHHVYFSSVLADVESRAAAADKGETDETTYNPGVLRASTMYFWCVDEVKLGGVVDKGAVWSFTTGGAADKALWQWWSDISGAAVGALTSHADYPGKPSGSQLVDAFESPVDWADNYGQRILGWLKPPEDGDYTFWIAGDDEQQLWLSTDADPANVTMIANVPGWTPYRDFDNTGGGTGDAAAQESDAIPLKAGQKYYIEALGKEGGGGDSTSVAWQGPGIGAREVIAGKYVDTFVLPPLQAFSPSPADGQVDAPQAPGRSWSAGERAQQHEVYLGDDPNAVAAADTSSPLFQGRQAGTSYDAGDLEWDKTFYWRVDEINEGDPESPWIGRVWSFTTANFIPVDDFESYNDEEDMGTRIYETWIDGWITGNGSTVGNWDPPFAEQTIVHGGKQSMPLDYNNVVSPFYSEAYREFAPVRNWTVNGTDSLSVWFRGRLAAFVDEGNGAFTVGASGHDIWDAGDDFRMVYQRLNGNGSILVQVDSLQNTNGWAKAGVMIRESLDPGSKFADVIVSPANGVRFQARTITGVDAVSDSSVATPEQIALRAPVWVKLERTGDTFSGFYSADGTTWTAMAWNPQTITMTGTVYIGLCVTSHTSTAATTAEFSGVATTGNVSGNWQAAWIGVDADLTNGVASLYVAVEDSAGNLAVAVNPDPAAVNATDWTEWKVPLADLAGVNMTRVEKLYLGVGHRNSPAPDGAGRIYIDDIRVTRPEPTPEPTP